VAEGMADMCEILHLPDIVQFDGDFIPFFEAVYNIFKRDFVDSKPVFRGSMLRLKKYPLIDGYEYTFYHFTHEGDIESNRKPDIRRMERIAFPRPMIDNSRHPALKVWKNVRNNKIRILIYHPSEKYLVVLADRGEYILPWTAYTVDYPNRERKLLKEYQAYKNQNRTEK
jgi:hypothetical protein